MDMVLVYGEAGQNSLAARRLYAARFPNRRIPNHTTFSSVVQRGRDTGKLMPNHGRDGGPGQPQRILEIEDQILNMAHENPSVSTRQVAREIPGVSQSTVWRILHEEQLYPYHTQRVQALQPEDYPQRIQFCEWVLEQEAINPEFLSDVLATDESKFGLQCLDFLQNDLPGLLEDVPLDVRQRMWFLHDGAPPYFRLAVRQHLHNVYGLRWIGRGGPVLWPPRSPDLNPLDFFYGDISKTRFTGQKFRILKNCSYALQQLQTTYATESTFLFSS